MWVKDRFKNEGTLRIRNGHLNGPERRSYGQDPGTDRSFLTPGWVTPTETSLQKNGRQNETFLQALVQLRGSQPAPRPSTLMSCEEAVDLSRGQALKWQ